MSATKFDPRVNSMVSLVVKERQSVLGAGKEERPVKNFTIGPYIPKEGHRISSSAVGTAPPKQRPSSTGHRHTVTPPYLGPRGKWVRSELPTTPSICQSQNLSSTAKPTAAMISTIRGDRTIKPVVAVHSYLDNSPLIDSQCVYGGSTRPGTAAAGERPMPSRPSSKQVTSRLYNGMAASSQSRPNTATGVAGERALNRDASTIAGAFFNEDGHGGATMVVVNAPNAGVPDAQQTAFRQTYGTKYAWPRLSADDIGRISELGRNAVPGSAQTRLIGGKWRYVPRPVDGDVVYTDYYGPLGGGYTQSNYYGRSYEIKTRDFTKTKVVEDPAYQRVQANMTGIHNLRTKPGLALESTIMHADSPEQLAKVASWAPASTGLHYMQAYHRMQPAH